MFLLLLRGLGPCGAPKASLHEIGKSFAETPTRRDEDIVGPEGAPRIPILINGDHIGGSDGGSRSTAARRPRLQASGSTNMSRLHDSCIQFTSASGYEQNIPTGVSDLVSPERDGGDDFDPEPREPAYRSDRQAAQGEGRDRGEPSRDRRVCARFEGCAGGPGLAAVGSLAVDTIARAQGRETSAARPTARDLVDPAAPSSPAMTRIQCSMSNSPAARAEPLRAMPFSPATGRCWPRSPGAAFGMTVC